VKATTYVTRVSLINRPVCVSSAPWYHARFQCAEESRIATPLQIVSVNASKRFTMKHFPSGLLFAILVVTAGTISADSDRNAPTATSLLSGRTDASANRPDGPFQGGRFATVDVPGATATRLFAINDWGVAVGRYESAGQTHGFRRSATGKLATIDFPDAGFTVAGALNNRGDIVGWYTLPIAPTVRHGFLLQDGQFTTFDPPGSTFTNALGINDRGDIVGRFCTITSFVCRQPGSGDFHGFLLRDGVFTILDVPGSIETNAWKINH
jgi:hypothetical protein